MSTLAILVLTYNEGKNIADCLHSASFADQLVVVDSDSTDDTREIARSLGAKCVVHPMDGFAAQRNFALTQADADWVMFLDADERITPELAAEVKCIIKQVPPRAYEILRINYLFGQKVLHGGYAPDYSLRLYPREAIYWEGLVHEQAIVSLPVARTKACMYHYPYNEWDRYLFKFNQYTTMMAQQMLERGKKPFFYRDILLRPAFAFFKVYILQRGFLDGKIGLVMALNHFFYTLFKYVKFNWHFKSIKKEEN